MIIFGVGTLMAAYMTVVCRSKLGDGGISCGTEVVY